MAEDMTDVGAFWDAIAARYAGQVRGFTSGFAALALARLGVGPGTRVLDVGTGIGAAAFAAAQLGASVTAIDVSAAMIEQVRALAMPGVAVLQMDGQALELPDAAFDATISIFGVTLFPNWRAGLREMARVTRPEGLAAVATWADGDGAAGFLLLARTVRALFPDRLPTPRFTGLAACSEPAHLSEALVAAGFAEPSIERITRNYALPVSDLDTPDRVFGGAPVWEGLDEPARAAVLARIRAQATGEILQIPSTALIAVARR